MDDNPINPETTNYKTPEKPDVLEYANMARVPGVEILAEGADGTFHLRITPVLTQDSGVRMAASVLYILFGFALIGLMVYVYSKSLKPENVVLTLGTILFMFWVVYRSVRHLVRTIWPLKLGPVEILARDSKLIFKYVDRECPPIDGRLIRKIWFKSLETDLFMNVRMGLFVWLKDHTQIEYQFMAPNRMDIYYGWYMLRKALKVPDDQIFLRLIRKRERHFP